MPSLEITGTERALPFESILVNILIKNHAIERIRLNMDEIFSIRKALNYKLERPEYNLKEKEFLVSELERENTLSLILFANIPKEMGLYSIKVEGVDSNGEVTLMGTHSILIMIPKIELIGKTERDELDRPIVSIKMKKINEIVSTFFHEFKIRILDIKGKNVPFDKIKISDEDYIRKLDAIPSIFNPDNYIEEIVIYSKSPVKLFIEARFSDLQGNEYKSNVCELYLEHPVREGVNKTMKKRNVLPFMFSPIQGIEPMYSSETSSAISI